MQVLCALNFYAGGTYQRRVGRDAHNYVSQSIVSRSVRVISEIISTKLGPKYIKFPQTPGEIEKVKQEFFIRYGVPGIRGLVDGSHIPLAALENEIEMAFMNRKSFHSLNVQFITDLSDMIRNVNARFPGSNNDFTVWANSNIRCHLEGQYNSGVYDEYLFGDTGYTLEPWLLTPISNPADEIDAFFNRIHKTIRSGIERTIALLKGRFRCLLGERKLRYAPVVCAHIVNACVVLHNILVSNNVPFNGGNLGVIVPVEVPEPNEYYDVGNGIRRLLAETIY